MTEQNRTKPNIMTTRPKLVSMLLMEEIEVQQEPNPFQPDKKSWTFQPIPQAIEIAKKYYQEQQEPLPKNIQRWCK